MSNRRKVERMTLTPPGSENRVGVGQPIGPVSSRCRATHDVPYTLRCLHDDGHKAQHEDKEGRRW